MGAFEEGYAFFEKQAGVQYAGYEGGVYVLSLIHISEPTRPY